MTLLFYIFAHPLLIVSDMVLVSKYTFWRLQIRGRISTNISGM